MSALAWVAVGVAATVSTCAVLLFLGLLVAARNSERDDDGDGRMLLADVVDDGPELPLSVSDREWLAEIGATA